MQLEIEQRRGREGRRRRAARARGDRARARRAARAGGRHERPVAGREGRDRGPRRAAASGSSRRACELERAEREVDLERAAELRYGEIPELEAAARRARGAEPEDGEPAGLPARGGRRRRRRRGRRQVDRHPGLAPAGGRGREARSTWRSACTSASSARTRPSTAVANALRRSRAGLQRPRPPDRHVPVPRPDRRRQDRAGARAGRVHVRLAGRDGPDRHVRVHGEALRRRGSSARRPATSATRRAASSPRRCAAGPTRSCCSTRSRRRTPTSSTSCCR